MRKIKVNLPLGIGLILFSILQILTHFVGIPDGLHYALLSIAIVFELWGIILLARSPEMKNSKIRQWKLRLIGKAE